LCNHRTQLAFSTSDSILYNSECGALGGKIWELYWHTRDHITYSTAWTLHSCALQFVSNVTEKWYAFRLYICIYCDQTLISFNSSQSVPWIGVRMSPLGTSATNWPIVPAPDYRWWMWSSQWNENWQEKPKYSEKTCPIATLSTTNPTWPDPGSNLGGRGGNPATNCLSYGTSIFQL
jgi:hypothetical protein